MLEHQIKNRQDWYRLVRQLATERYSNFASIRRDENGWSWIEVGHNASHAFYIGHDANYDTFAVKSIGEGMFPEDATDEERLYGIPPMEVDIRRHAHTLSETMAGGYFGHF